MAIKVSSRKGKARVLQNKTRDMIFKECLSPMCEAGDIRCALMGEVGPDIVMSPLAQKHWRLGGIECKNQEKISIWSALKQAEQYGEDSLLVFKRNRSPIYACLRLDVLLKLL